MCRLKKALYWLKQAPRDWYGDADPNLYYLMVEGESLILVLYVDDLFMIGSSGLIKDCKRNLAA